MKFKSVILSLFLFACGDVDKVLPPHIENRMQSLGNQTFYDSYLKIKCQSTEGRYVLNPAKCIPGYGKVMYSNNRCTDFDSLIPTGFLEEPAKYATSTDIGQFYSIGQKLKFKGPGLYEVVNWQCVEVIDSITAYDINEIVSYQIFGDL